MKARLGLDGLLHMMAGTCFLVLAALLPLGIVPCGPWRGDDALWTPEGGVAVRVLALCASAAFLGLGSASLIAGVALLREKG